MHLGTWRLTNAVRSVGVVISMHSNQEPGRVTKSPRQTAH